MLPETKYLRIRVVFVIGPQDSGYNTKHKTSCLMREKCPYRYTGIVHVLGVPSPQNTVGNDMIENWLSWEILQVLRQYWVEERTPFEVWSSGGRGNIFRNFWGIPREIQRIQVSYPNGVTKLMHTIYCKDRIVKLQINVFTIGVKKENNSEILRSCWIHLSICI